MKYLGMKRVVADFETNEGAINGNLTSVFLLCINDGETVQSISGFYQDTIEYLNDYFKDVVVIFHNAAFDLWVAASLGIEIPYYEDTCLLSYCLNPSGSHSLAALATLFNTPHQKMDAPSFDSYSEEMEVYCENDCLVTWEVYYCLNKEANTHPRKKDVLDLYYGVELPFIRSIIEMNHTGITMDFGAWDTIIGQVEAGAKELLDRIHNECSALAPVKKSVRKTARNDALTNFSEAQDGHYWYDEQSSEPGKLVYWKVGEYNPGSQNQTAFLMKELYGWEPEVFTPSGTPKLDKEVLQEISNPLAELLVKYSKVQKIATTYGKSLQEKVSDDGRLRGSFNQMVTLTGRLSSSKPNLNMGVTA